jgi:flavin-binding protein dodecin
MSYLSRSTIKTVSGKLLPACLLLAAALLWPQAAPAQDLLAAPTCVPPGPGNAGGFEIDGELECGSVLGTVVPGLDWYDGTRPACVNGVLNSGGLCGTPKDAFRTVFISDPVTAGSLVDESTFAGSSNKNNDDIAAGVSPWAIEAGNAPQKTDLTEVYLHTLNQQCAYGDVQTWLILGFAYRSTDGDKHADFEFFQDGVTLEGGKIVGLGPNNGRKGDGPGVGGTDDFIISVDYVNGGAQACVTIHAWDGTKYVEVTPPAGAICNSPTDPDASTYSAVNQNRITTPCEVFLESSTGKRGYAYAKYQFAEAAVNLSAFGIDVAKFCKPATNLLVKTRSSDSFTSELKDFAAGTFRLVQPPTCELTGPDKSCTGETKSYTATVSSPSATLAWSIDPPSAGTIIPTADPYTIDVLWAGSGTVKLAVADLNSPADCNGECQLAVTVYDKPGCSIDGLNAVCTGNLGNRYCAPAGMASYEWSISGDGSFNPLPGLGDQCVKVDAGPAGSFTVTVKITDANGCTSTCDKTVTVLPEPPCSIEGPSAVCTGSTGDQYCGPAGMAKYEWSISGNGAFSPVPGIADQCAKVSAGAAGTYKVTLKVTDANGCTSICDKTVNVLPEPSCSIEGPSAACIGSAGNQYCAPEGMAKYEWSISGNGSFDPAPGLADRCVKVNAGAAGSYKVSLKVTDTNGCTSICDKTVTISAAPTCSIEGPSAVCPASVGNRYCGPVGMAKYEWSISGNGVFNPAPGFTDQCANVSATAAGTYEVTLKVTDAGGCTAVCEKTVTVSAEPTCFLEGPGAVCPGSAGHEYCGPAGMAKYEWSISGEGAFYPAPSLTSQCATVETGTVGTYKVTLKVTDTSGCVSTCDKTVTVLPGPACSISGRSRVCADSTGWRYCGPDGMAKYEWSISGNGTFHQVPGPTDRCVTVDAGPVGSFRLTLTLTDTNGCASMCEKTVYTVLCGDNCPRTVGFWGRQCAQMDNGSTKFTKAEVAQIASCGDDLVELFSWTDDFDGFCSAINVERPMDCRKQAYRQFSALLANVCVTDLGLEPARGGKIYLDSGAANPCKSAFPDAATITDLIQAIDAQLVKLRDEGAGAQDQRYCAVVECTDGINNGQGIPLDLACYEDVDDPDAGDSSGGDVHTMGGGTPGSGTTESGTTAAVQLQLYRPSPNPFAHTTTIAYEVAGQAAERVEIGIYNVAGRLVRKLVSDYRTAGRYETTWDGRDDGGVSVTHGVYFLRAYVGGQNMSAAASRILYLR